MSPPPAAVPVFGSIDEDLHNDFQAHPSAERASAPRGIGCVFEVQFALPFHHGKPTKEIGSGIYKYSIPRDEQQQ